MTSEDVLRIMTVVVKAALDTPAGKEFVSTVEEAAIREAPGAAGALLRALSALAPHDVVSLGLRRDGPG